MAEYFAVSKQTIYTTLKRWVQEGVKGLDDKSHARKAPRGATLEVMNEIRKRQENPLIGEWRMHAALLQAGINVPPRTCGRIMAKHRALYGWEKPTSTLKIEYQDTELSFYTMEWAEDNKHIKEVKNPRLVETGYQSPQLKLWTLGPDEWPLFLKLPDYAARKKPRKKPDVIQLPLFDPLESGKQAR